MNCRRCTYLGAYFIPMLLFIVSTIGLCLGLLVHPTIKTLSMVINIVLITFIVFQIQQLILSLPCHSITIWIYDIYRE